MKRRVVAPAVLAGALVCAAPGLAAEGAPLGHRDYRPSPARPVGWRGDGSGRFCGAEPVLEWSDGTVLRQVEGAKGRPTRRCWRDPQLPAKNILWRTALPSWSNASPIVVGDKVFVMSEPTGYAPSLVCLDGRDGTILWQHEVDHLDLLPPDRRGEIARQWAACWDRARQAATLLAGKSELDKRAAALAASKAEKVEPLADEAAEPSPLIPELVERPKPSPRQVRLDTELDAWRKRAGELGMTDLQYSRWGVAAAPGLVPPALAQTLKMLAGHNCYFHTWELGLSGTGGRSRLQVGAYAGYAHPTPVSDGTYVYVFTGYNAAACYDLQGRRRWLRWLGPYERVRSGAGWMDFTQSPVLVGTRLLVGTKRALTALDTATGQTLWARETHEDDIKRTAAYDCLLFTGIVFQAAGEDLFFWYDGRIYRVRDGRDVSGRCLGDDRLYISCCPIRHDAGVIYCAIPAADGKARGKSPVATAVRVNPADDGQVACEVLWRRELPGNPHNGVCWGGKVYLPISKGRPRDEPPRAARGRMDVILDLASGEPAGEACFAPDHLSGIVLAGKRLMTVESLRSGYARFRIHDLDGKCLAENYLSSAPAEGERLARIRSWTGRDGWHDGYYHGSFHAVPFFQGRRIYVRSRDELFCIGPTSD